MTRSVPEAKVLLDSVNEAGDRLTTLEVKMHRYCLAEANTHRALSRNSASSRAIPIAKQLDKVRTDPAMPIEWGKNQAGMQAAEVFTDPAEIRRIEEEWLWARDDAIAAVENLQRIGDKGVHKQIANRLLEPWLWHTCLISATDWQNFFNQRCSPLAQPEIRVAAEAIREAMHLSIPQLLHAGEWHTPLIQPDELTTLSEEDRKEIAVARCARVSYLTHDGKRDISEDLAMYKRLVDARPMHASPLEHVATPAAGAPGNFTGWRQLRHEIETDAGIWSWK